MTKLEQSKNEEFVKEQFIKGRILDGTKDYGRTQFVDEIYKLQQENQQLKDELKNKPDTQITLQDDKGNKFTLIQTERIDIQVELNKTIEKLFNNWNKLKEYIDIKLYNVEYLQKLCGYRIDDEIHMILDIIKKKMQELEIGIDQINNLKEK